MPNHEKHGNPRPLEPMSREELEAMRRAQLTRRSFLQRSGGVAAVAVGSAAGTAVVPGIAESQDAEEPYEYEFDGVPEAPSEPPSRELQALTEQEAAMVEALTARILPGTPDDPGAREAGVVYFIDHLLATNQGIHEATYTSGPYARVYEGDSPPEPDDEKTVWVKADQISRYGFQAALSPLQVYKISLPLVQRHAEQNYGAPVQELDEADQDKVVWDLLDKKVEGFDQFPSSAFFHTLRRHTAEGMFSDPAYGGNRDLVGWSLVGFPGAQRAYTPEELLIEDEPRPPQSLSGLPAFNPGVHGHDDHENVVQPVRESEDDGE